MDQIYYKHFKGKYYKFLYEAKMTETLEDVIVYQCLYGDGSIWARPKSMFFEIISRDGYTGPRFFPVSREEVISNVDPIFNP